MCPWKEQGYLPSTFSPAEPDFKVLFPISGPNMQTHYALVPAALIVRATVSESAWQHNQYGN